MEYKKIDNEILVKKNQIKQIDSLIDNEKNKIKKIDSMQENIVSISKSMNRCIDLISLSVKGSKTENMLNDMRQSNKLFYMNMSTLLDDENKISNKKINKLSEKKETIIKETNDKKE